MKFGLLSDEEFTKFVDNNSIKNFLQTVMMKKKLEKEGATVYLVGVKENNKVIGASLVSSSKHHFLGKITYEAYKGFVLDYNNKELVKFMTVELKKFLKEKNALNLFIDPYIPNVSRDMDANIIDGVDNRKINEYLRNIGYTYTEKGNQVKWCYCLDINGKTSAELFNEMRSRTRNYINRTITKYKLNIRTLKREELKEFKKITSDTCERRSFFDKSLEYYESMYDIFGDNVTFKIAELNCDLYISTLKEENSHFKSKLDKLSIETKKEKIKNDIESNVKKIDDIKKLKNKYGNIIPLSASMFILYGDEIVYLFGGSYEEFMNFYGQYRIQWEMIKYAADQGYKRYNFYGIEDISNSNENDCGIYKFKKGFGGYVEELLGYFELEISPLNKIYHLLKKVKSIIKK